MTDSITSVVEYHERTKHRLDGYAKGPGTIDWDAQPNPFRMFSGAPLTQLPLQADQHTVLYGDLYQPENIAQQALSLNSLALLLEVSVALSAWKQYGSARWSLRCNPSSGNLHPTETYLVLLGVEGVDDGVYHYRADQHGIEQRCAFQNSESDSASSPLVLIGFTSVHWREAWKYGERAFRYCQHDVGHAAAAVSYGAAIQGWSLSPLGEWGDEQISALLGINRDDDFQHAEREHPDQLFLLNAGSEESSDFNSTLAVLLGQSQSASWQGNANRLDRRHFYEWPIIDEVTEVATKPIQDIQQEKFVLNDIPKPLPIDSEETAAKLFRSRRSAQGFDGETLMNQQDFFTLLDHLQSRPQLAPWNSLSKPPAVHLVFFIHRVDGLKPGVYALPRSDDGLELMKSEMRDEFTWNPVEGAPNSASFYELVLARSDKAATQVSCHQPIAGQSCFSLAMLAEFETTVEQTPWRYRELFWETGAIGQVLYLEAEAFHLRGTGIGCYFDDAVHSIFGITSKKLQSLYHFTVGGPLIDERIVSLPPYSHLSS